MTNPNIPPELGWGIYHAEGSIDNADGRRTYQLQRDDEMKLFAGDVEAQKAMLASEYRDEVMAFLMHESPAEFEDIRRLEYNGVA